MDQNILLNKTTSFGDSYYIVKSKSSDKRNIPIDCDTPLKVMHKNAQGGNDKTHSTYLKNITVTQDASTNTNTCVNKGTDSYSELVFKSLKDHTASLENQLKDKQYIIIELLGKSFQSSYNYTVVNSNLIDAQKYHTKHTENPMIPSTSQST